MKTKTYKLKDLEKVMIGLGYVGENDHTRVVIDAGEVFGDHPQATVGLAVVPPMGERFPVTVARDGDLVEWTVKNSVLIHDGDGRFQLTFMDGSEIIKSCRGQFRVKESIPDGGDVPDPIQDWIDEANEVVEEAREAAAAAEHQPRIGQDGYWEIWDLQDGQYVTTGVKAQGEQGDPGPAGEDGAPGQDGHTPEKGVDYWTEQDRAAMAADVVSDVIDDTAGDGDTNKTWSADKIAETTGQLLNAIDGVSNELFIEKGQDNLFSKHSDYMTLALNDTLFGQGSSLYGFYVPIDPSKGTTITIKRKNTGKRFRFVSCQNQPAVGVTYENGKLVYVDNADNTCVYNKILSTDRYLYVAFYSTSQDTYTMDQLLEGMQIFYGTEFSAKTKVSRLDELDREKNPNFANGKIDSSGNFVASNKHITSDFIRVDGKFGISVPSDYVMKVHLFDDDYSFKSTTSKTNAVSYIDHIGYVRFTIETADESDITPETVDFSSIKIPLNRYSAEIYTNKNTFILDAENAMCDDVFAYIDDAVSSHGFYAEKTSLCTAFNIPLYYYTLGSGAKKIMLIGGQHGPGSGGDPRDSVITLAKFMHDLINGDFENGSFLQTLHDEYTFLIIPILNGYGFNNRTRTNGDDVDLNRDWTAGNTTEVAAAKALITSFDPFMILDVHCNGTTPIYDADVTIQFGLGSHNTTFNNAVESKFKEYYDTDTETRWPNTADTLQYYIITTLQKLGGLLELRWWTKSKVCLHDAQAESANYAMLVNVIKYCASVNDSGSYSWEKTPNQNQY